MKISLSFKVAVLAALLSAVLFNFSQAQIANETQSAKQFVASLYSHYGPNGDPPNLSGDNASQFFAPSLIQLAKAVRTAAGPRYSGALDYDHLCNCKDTNVTFPNLQILTKYTTRDQTVATVTFTGNDKRQNRIMINLTQEGGNWRISDIKDYTGPAPYTSLRGLLKREMKAWSKVQPVR